MNERSSNILPTASAFYDPDSSCWRTSQESLLSEVPSLLERLPDWATTADGVLYAHRTPALLIAVRVGGVSLSTLPTHRVSMRHGPSERELAEGDPKARLDTAAALLPTPITSDANTSHPGDGQLRTVLLPTPTQNNAKESGTVRDWGGDPAAALLPTPAAGNPNDGESVESWTARQARRQEAGEAPFGMPLAVATARLLPTPMATGEGSKRDLEARMAKGQQMQLTEIVRLLPTPQASDAKSSGPNMDWQLRLTNHAPSTVSVLMNLLPTPTSRDWKDTGDLKKSVPDDDSLLPRAIAHHVISDPTQEQSDDGNLSPDD